MVVKRGKLLFRGTVQGVGFRYMSRNLAYEIGLIGWVRNLPDGDVEAIVEGEERDILAFVEGCKCFDGVSVSEARLDWDSPTAEFSGFSIRR